jgi:hypothetical protein
METKQATNYLIDWKSLDEKAIEDRKNYLKMLRGLLTDLDNLKSSAIGAIFAKWNVYFIDVDEFDRVNLDIPK